MLSVPLAFVIGMHSIGPPPISEQTRNEISNTIVVEMGPPSIFKDTRFGLPRLLVDPSDHPEITPPAFRTGEGLLTVLYIGDGSLELPAAVERDGDVARIWIDENRNGDLRDDEPVELSLGDDEARVIAVASSLDGYPVSYSLFQLDVFEGMQKMMERKYGRRGTRETTLWDQRMDHRAGEVVIDGETHLLGLSDWEFDGRYDSEDDLLLIDRNGDREVSLELMSGEAIAGAKAVQIGEMAYAVEIDPGGDYLLLSPRPDLAIEIQRLGAGDTFPTLNHEALEGDASFDIRSFRGRWVLVDFWGEWCMPCVRQIPALVELERELGADQFGIAGFLTGGNPERASRVLERHNAEWPNAVISGDEASRDYLVTGFPTKFLLDPEGVIVAVNPGLDDVRKAVVGE